MNMTSHTFKDTEYFILSQVPESFTLTSQVKSMIGEKHCV